MGTNEILADFFSKPFGPKDLVAAISDVKWLYSERRTTRDDVTVDFEESKFSRSSIDLEVPIKQPNRTVSHESCFTMNNALQKRIFTCKTHNL